MHMRLSTGTRTRCPCTHYAVWHSDAMCHTLPASLQASLPVGRPVLLEGMGESVDASLEPVLLKLTFKQVRGGWWLRWLVLQLFSWLW